MKRFCYHQSECSYVFERSVCHVFRIGALPKARSLVRSSGLIVKNRCANVFRTNEGQSVESGNLRLLQVRCVGQYLTDNSSDVSNDISGLDTGSIEKTLYERE